MPTKKHASPSSTAAEKIMLATEPHHPTILVERAPSPTSSSDHPPEGRQSLFGTSFAEAIKAAITPSP
jgi:hypothetical protein